MMRTSDAAAPGLTRRRLLVTGGAGVGLIVGWAIWPRAYAPNLVVRADEHPFGAYLKIAQDGRVIVAVPQIETGQGVYTTLPQIVADELGADWRTVEVEPAPINPLYANRLFATELAEGLSSRLSDVADTFATRSALMVTAGSTSIRMFEAPLRAAAAEARARLMTVAAHRYPGAQAGSLDTDQGFVIAGKDRIRFGELAADAVSVSPEKVLPRSSGTRLSGQSLPRLDTPAKLDGSANFAADIRLPGMVFAAMRQGPIGSLGYRGGDRAAADRVPGVTHLIETGNWVAAVASTSWAAERALDVLRPRFATKGSLLDDARIEQSLTEALEQDGDRLAARGDPEQSLASGAVLTADYSVEPAIHASLEPVTATAQWRDGRLSIWLPTIAPEAARQTVARALDLDPALIVIHATQVGGGFGRGMSSEAAVQAGHLSRTLKRPVQLFWSRAEAILRGRFRPPARARLTGGVSGGRMSALLTKIAAPDYGRVVAETLLPTASLARTVAIGGPDAFAVMGAETPYEIEHLAVDHHSADPQVPLGYWRSGAYSYTCFFTESFVDELARSAQAEPFSFRMAMLGRKPRLARCLSTVAALGGWQGGEIGTGQGLAVHAAYGSFIAVMAEARADGGRVNCERIVAVADVGRMINPDIVRQQIEGGLLFGLAGATGAAPGFANGLTRAQRLADLNLPRLADAPEITVELIESNDAPGGASELAVPPVAPALANALFAATGRRYRKLPLQIAPLPERR